ncbi:3-hydroxybutyrate oligomer hydrolase family protein [Paraburkholderia madseniana]|uniref:3-hydroxybutyrate oligomer hydrolase family protein n=1 Tax=Paraburkholderia madseniana TaxID=2599607 RepID=UPI0038B9C9DF
MATRKKAVLLSAAIVSAVLVPVARADDHDDRRPGPNGLPWFVVADSLRTTTYDGISDDLLTAGLGKTGLAGPAPAIAKKERSGRTLPVERNQVNKST